MKKWLSICTAALLTASIALTGCGKNSDGKSSGTKSDDNKKVVLKGIGWQNEESMKPYLDLLKEKLPNIEIDYQFVDLKQYNNILNTQLASGEGADLIMVSSQVKTLASAGYLEDLSNVPVIDKYNKTGFNIFTYKDKIYGIPALTWFEGVFYNKEIFEKNNIKVPKSFDEWIKAMETLKTAGIKPMTIGAKSWEAMMKQSVGLVLNEVYTTEEGKNFDADFEAGKKTLDGNWNNAVNKWAEIVKKGFITKDMLGLDYDQAQDEFALGKVAMWESGPWSTDALKKKNPNLKFGMFPIPGIKEGSGYMIGGPGWGWAINKVSKNKDQVLKVFEATATPEAQKAFFEKMPGSSFLKGVDLKIDDTYDDCKEAFSQGKVHAPWVGWYGGETIAIEYGKLLQEYLSGQKTIDEVLKATDKKVQEVFKTQK